MFASKRSWAPVLLSLALAVPRFASAAPVIVPHTDSLLPPDTEVVVTVNVKQILGSELLKKAGVEKWKQQLKAIDPVNDVLQDLGFDPFKDLERVTIASPGGSDKDRGLIIVRGTFDTAKFKAKADDALKTNGDALKAHKVPDGKGGQQLVFETTVPGQELPLFVAVASNDLLLASPGKDYVVDALKKVRGGNGPAFRNKDMRALLEKMDPNQSLSIAGLAAALGQDPQVSDAVKNALDKLDAIGGGITITDEIKVEFILSAKSTEAAKETEKVVSDVLNQGLGMAAFLAGQKKEFAPAVEVLKSIRSSAKGKLVTIKAQVGADILDKALGKDK